MASGSWFQSQGCVSRTYIPCRLGDEAWRISAYVLQTSIISHHNIPLNDFTTEKHGWSVHPPTHPTTNNQTNSKKQTTTHTQQQPQQTNKQTTTKQQISTKTDNPNNNNNNKSPPRSTYSTVLCFVFYVDCSPLFILWFSFCSRLFILLLWMRQTKLGLNGEKTSDARRNKTKTNLRLTIAQSHSDRQQPSAWR